MLPVFINNIKFNYFLNTWILALFLKCCFRKRFLGSPFWTFSSNLLNFFAKTEPPILLSQVVVSLQRTLWLLYNGEYLSIVIVFLQFGKKKWLWPPKSAVSSMVLNVLKTVWNCYLSLISLYSDSLILVELSIIQAHVHFLCLSINAKW